MTTTLDTGTKGSRTRARLLTCAVDHFAAVGLDAGSVPEIARMAGMSHSSVYQHFGRKETLFRNAVDADLSGLFATPIASLRAENHTAESLVGMIAVVLDGCSRHPLARRVLANIDGEQADAMRELPALALLEAELGAAVSRAQAAHTVRSDRSAASLAEGLISVALSVVVVALRVDGLPAVPRARSTYEFLVTALLSDASATRSSDSSEQAKAPR